MRTRAGLIAIAMMVMVTVMSVEPLAVLAPDGEPFDPLVMGEVWRYEHGAENGTLWSMCWSPDGQLVAAAFFNNDVVVLNATSGEVVTILKASPEEDRCDGYAPSGHLPTRAVAWSPDGAYLAASGDDRVVYVFDTATWDIHRQLARHLGSVQSLAWSNSGDRLASGSGRDKVLPNGVGENETYIWDVDTATVLVRLVGHRDSVLGIAWSPDDSRIATASDDRTARVWDPATGEELVRLEGHTSGVLDCCWSPNGSRLVTGSRDYKARLWDVEANGSLGRWSDNNCVRSVDWHPDSDIIATSGVDRTLKFRNSTTGGLLNTIDDGIELESVVMKSRFDPSGVYLAATYGKAAILIVYGPVGSGADDGDDGRTAIAAAGMVAISVVGVILLVHPAIRKARRRRG